MIVEILTFLLVLSVLVLVHEFGHFWVARRNGVWVEEFGFGLPPRVLSKKVGDTIYSINLLPFGGFVRLHGENSGDSVVYPNKSFLNKSKKVRASIVVAGVVMNFLLAVASFAIVYSVKGIPTDTGVLKVIEVTSGSPAQVAGIVSGDIIKLVGKEEVTSVKEFVELVEKEKGKKVALELDGRKVILTPRQTPPEGEGPIGVVITTTEIYFPPMWQRPFVGAYYGFKDALFWGETVVVGFAKVFIDLFGGTVPKDLAGPVGIYAITQEAAKSGAITLINFIGILSVNLAILNIIPFPALDGGRLLFIFLEKLLGRKVLPKLESAIHTVGMIILLLAIIAITASDIKRLITAGGITNFLK